MGRFTELKQTLTRRVSEARALLTRRVSHHDAISYRFEDDYIFCQTNSIKEFIDQSRQMWIDDTATRPIVE